jgi:hypothetical protein
MGVGGQRHAPATLPTGKTQCPLYRRLGGHQGQSGRLRKISPPPGLDPRAVQPTASRYTDYANPAPKFPDGGVLEFIVPLNALTAVHSTEAGNIRITGPYNAPRPERVDSSMQETT